MAIHSVREKRELRRSSFSLASTALSSSCDRLEGWMFWQKDAAYAHRWTKVYAMLRNQHLCLYRGKQNVQDSSKGPLVQLAVHRVSFASPRRFHIYDASGITVTLLVYEEAEVAHWHDALVDASDTAMRVAVMKERPVDELLEDGVKVAGHDGVNPAKDKKPRRQNRLLQWLQHLHLHAKKQRS